MESEISEQDRQKAAELVVKLNLDIAEFVGINLSAIADEVSKFRADTRAQLGRQIKVALLAIPTTSQSGKPRYAAGYHADAMNAIDKILSPPEQKQS